MVKQLLLGTFDPRPVRDQVNKPSLAIGKIISNIPLKSSENIRQYLEQDTTFQRILYAYLHTVFKGNPERIKWGVIDLYQAQRIAQGNKIVLEPVIDTLNFTTAPVTVLTQLPPSSILLAEGIIDCATGFYGSAQTFWIP